MLTIRYRNKINLIKKFLLLLGGALESGRCWRWFLRCFIAYLFAYLIIRQTFNRVVFLVLWHNALSLPRPLHLSLCVCRVFLYRICGPVGHTKRIASQFIVIVIVNNLFDDAETLCARLGVCI